ncbi:MAG: glycoside hydrolase family 6 protein [bacterium]|nr:glycoside hydrolase family 6 protein [bacterium]
MSRTSLIGIIMVMLFSQQTFGQSPEEKLPFKGQKFYLEPYNQASEWAKQHAQDPAAKAATFIGGVPSSVWLGVGGDDHAKVKQTATEATQLGKNVVFVSYRAPKRDLGGDSKGGADSLKAYKDWVDSTVSGLAEVSDLRREKSAEVVNIVEPDAMGHLKDMKDEVSRKVRIEAVRYNVLKWATEPLVYSYIDAAHPGWFDTSHKDQLDQIVNMLVDMGIQHARGISVNVSNYYSFEKCATYGERICAELEKRGHGRKYFVIDTSRNGTSKEPKQGEFKNLPGQGLGKVPSGEGYKNPKLYPHLDATLWIKHPGESDGVGGQSQMEAGQFDPALALELYNNRLTKDSGYFGDLTRPAVK